MIRHYFMRHRSSSSSSTSWDEIDSDALNQQQLLPSTDNTTFWTRIAAAPYHPGGTVPLVHAVALPFKFRFFATATQRLWIAPAGLAGWLAGWLALSCCSAGSVVVGDCVVRCDIHGPCARRVFRERQQGVGSRCIRLWSVWSAADCSITDAARSQPGSLLTPIISHR